MAAHVEGPSFVSFICPGCHQEIEVPSDRVGKESECPACAAPFVIPADAAKRPSQAQIDAMKGRTIRIELPDGL